MSSADVIHNECSTNLSRLALRRIRIAIAVICSMVTGFAIAGPQTTSDQAIPIGKFLRTDGSLALPVAFSGSLDGKGYRMLSGRDGEPIFVQEASQNTEGTLFGIPSGCNGSIISAVLAPSGLIYFGGHFTVCEDVQARGIVAYDPVSRRFQRFAGGLAGSVNGAVAAFAYYQGDLYIGGSFTEAGGIATGPIARWDGTEWNALPGLLSENNFSSRVNALRVVDDGLFVGGIFTTAGNLVVNSIAKWNGQAWFSLGEGVKNPPRRFRASVYAFATFQGQLIVSGDFLTAGPIVGNGIASWNGASWQSLGVGLSRVDGQPGIATSLAASSDTLYVGGNFFEAGGVQVYNIARWDGASWSAMGSDPGIFGVSPRISFIGSSASVANAMAMRDGRLYVGGTFEIAGDRQATNLAYFENDRWHPVEHSSGEGIEKTILLLSNIGGDLYIGGGFDRVADEVANGVVLLGGNVFAPLGQGTGNGVRGQVYALAANNGRLFVGGTLSQAGGIAVKNIGVWNGSSWAAMGAGVSGPVRAIAVNGSDVYAGGSFGQAGGQPANFVARWNGTFWSPMGTGVNGTVYALTAAGSDLYVGGSFSSAGGQTANGIARWDGSGWSVLGAGVSGRVQAIAVNGGHVHVGGSFSRAGGVSANNVATWNGSQWSGLGAGVDALVYALAISGSDLIVGGSFVQAGNQPANRIARWNGSNWSALGEGAENGLNGSVYALAASDNNIYVGGSFSQAGSQSAFGAAYWDGLSWRNLSSSDGQQTVLALLARDSSLVVGGANLVQTPLPGLVSSSLSGAAANGASRRSLVSSNGAILAFVSDASDLVSGDNNGRTDIFIRSSAGGAVERISSLAELANGGAQESFSEPALSMDGSRIAFSGSTGQVYGVAGGLARVLSRSASGELGNGPSGKAHLSGNGSLAFFESRSSNLSPLDGNGSVADIFVTAVDTGAITLISMGPNGEPANGPSFGPWASADGQTIVYSTLATNIVPGAPAGKAGTVTQATMVRGGGFGQTRLYLSRNLTTGELGNGHSINVRVTPDGRYGVFESLASNLVANDTNGASDIFRYEIRDNTLISLERVSISRYSLQGNGPSRNPSISDDGQYVTFESEASNLVELDRNETTDVLVKWMVTGDVIRLSRTVDGEQPNGPTVEPDISGDGSTVVFGSAASNLTPNDTNGVPDVFSVELRAPAPPVATGPLDEPGFSGFALPPPGAAFPNCPGGYFVAAIDDGPGAGLSPGIFGLDLILNPPGSLRLEGGLNFGGSFDASQVAFAGFNIQNDANEPQRLELILTGNPASSQSGALPVRIQLIRQPTAGVNELVFESVTTLSLAQAYTRSLVLQPGFHVVTVGPEGAGAIAGGPADGQVYVSLASQFVDRPGGGFFGGVVVGGYHAAPPFGDNSGFASFCLGTAHTATARLLSAPTYGPTGARDLRLRLLDFNNETVISVPQ